jgi:hypothetical protein
MAERTGAVSSLEEFWAGLEARGVEPDLVETLRARAARDGGPVERVGDRDLVVAVAGRLLPGAVPAGALAAFLDANFDRPLGRGDERVGGLPREELLPAGFAVLDEEARRRHGAAFTELEGPQQDELLRAAERGALSGPERFDAREWFHRVHGLLLLAYGSDPRGMVEMGFPGPSYEKGHVWLTESEVERRAAGARGYLEL